MRRGYVDTARGQMHYREAGKGLPIILVHQALRSSLEYRLVTPLLSNNWRVISIDLMGYGDSDMPDQPHAVSDHAARLREFVDALGLKRLVVAGHHTGANVALEFAASYPKGVEALILSGPAVVIGEKEKSALVKKMSAIQYPSPRADGSHLLLIWREGLVSSFDVPRIPATEVELLHDFFLEQIKVGARRKEAHIAAFSHDALGSAPRVKAPTLLIIGKNDMWSCARGAELKAALSNGELQEFDAAGEMPRLNPELWSSTIRAFLEKHQLAGRA
jgi:pimeloyl-ACP methyl ester carboxylesterase